MKRHLVSECLSARFDDLVVFPSDSDIPSAIVIFDKKSGWISVDEHYVSDPRTEKRHPVIGVDHQIAHFWKQDDAHGREWSRSLRGPLKRAPLEKHFHSAELDEISRWYLGSQQRCIYDEWPG